jgi:DNA repair exonuclease SbcCD ATPase subunit
MQMNKIERDKLPKAMDKKRLNDLRKGDIYALASLCPAEIEAWGMAIFPADMRVIISPLLDHIDALEQRMIAVEAERDRYRDLYELIGKSVAAALERAGIEAVDGPGESIDVVAEERDQLRNALDQQVHKINEIAHQLETYNPAADEYHGQYIHKGWASQLRAIANASDET